MHSAEWQTLPGLRSEECNIEARTCAVAGPVHVRYKQLGALGTRDAVLLVGGPVAVSTRGAGGVADAPGNHVPDLAQITRLKHLLRQP